jgi:hypothetical protein
MRHKHLFVNCLPESKRGMERFSSLVLFAVVLALAGCKQAASPSLSNAKASASDSQKDSASSPQPANRTGDNNRIRAVFAVFEGSRINLYASDLDGSNRKLLVSEETPFTNGLAPVHYAIKARVSPGRHSIAFMCHSQGDTSVYLIDAEGQNKRKLFDNADAFDWSPDGKKIVYSVLPRSEESNGFVGRPSWDPGFEWRICDTQTGESELISSPQDRIQKEGAWIEENHIIIISNSTAALYLLVLDLSTIRTTENKLLDGFRQITNISANTTTGRTIVSILPDLLTGKQACDIYELTSSWGLGRRLVAIRNGESTGLAWNGNDEILFSTLILGQKLARAGYHRVLSVSKYNLISKRNEPVLKDVGTEGYRVEGTVAGKALVVSAENVRQSPRYVLQVRRLDGSHPVPLVSSEKGVAFIGWLK